MAFALIQYTIKILGHTDAAYLLGEAVGAVADVAERANVADEKCNHSVIIDPKVRNAA